ncbi:hypothetical protein SAMN02745166_03945 [Prosthecobacter debontii]|uniref:Uncharacterized protein n=1 Tax=Prosthecobacter debontii TaxID=48467 RepID=A0A1T4YQ02_9BACT|nr:hypothetical protein SAMN02745166_03945 [Prosthecobacter debontii]
MGLLSVIKAKLGTMILGKLITGLGALPNDLDGNKISFSIRQYRGLVGCQTSSLHKYWTVPRIKSAEAVQVKGLGFLLCSTR